MQKILLFLAIGFLLLTAFNLSTTFLSPPLPSNQIGVVSADKMNVLYIGVDNPISVVIAGVPIEQTKVSVSDGTISETDKLGTYNVRVTRPGKLTIRAEGITNQGKTVSKELDFRIKRISDPTIKLGKKRGGRIKIAHFKNQKGLTAELENFNYDAEFHIVCYTISLNHHQDILMRENRGATFQDAAKVLIQKAKKGDVISFDDIRVKGPDETNRKLPPLSFLLY